MNDPMLFSKKCDPIQESDFSKISRNSQFQAKKYKN